MYTMLEDCTVESQFFKPLEVKQTGSSYKGVWKIGVKIIQSLTGKGKFSLD